MSTTTDLKSKKGGKRLGEKCRGASLKEGRVERKTIQTQKIGREWMGLAGEACNPDDE